MLFKARKESDPSLSKRLLAEAADWLVALEGLGQPTRTDLTLNGRFYEWLMHSPERLRAFLEIANVYSTLSESSCGFIVTSGQLAGLPDCSGAVSANVIPLKGYNGTGRCSARGSLRSFRLMGSVGSVPRIVGRSRVNRVIASCHSWRTLAAIAGVLAAAVCAWLLAPSLTVAPADIRHYSTRIGERTIIPFKDGSTVYLNTASRIELQSNASLHSVHLLSGEALLDAPSPAAPMRLCADELQVDSVAAQFDVRREAMSTLVSVLNGRVRVSCRCATREILLTAGEQLEVSRHDGAAYVRRKTLPVHERANLVMWRDGHLFFQGEPLSAAVKELNRYNRQQVVVGDAETADLRVGGRFSANDVDSFIAAIQKTFGVRAQLVRPIEQDSYIVLLSRNAAQTPPSVTKPVAARTAMQQHRTQ